MCLIFAIYDIDVNHSAVFCKRVSISYKLRAGGRTVSVGGRSACSWGRRVELQISFCAELLRGRVLQQGYRQSLEAMISLVM